jgi:PAS domain S-box-containing protein
MISPRALVFPARNWWRCVRSRLPTRSVAGGLFSGLMLLAGIVAEVKAATPTVSFVDVSVAQGLSQSTVQAIVQDHIGFLWFGTDEGLNRYDGYGFVVFKHDPQNPRSILDSVVSALFEDSRHRLWVGTEHGLCSFDRRTETFTAVNAIRDRVSEIIETKDGTVWVAAVSGGLFLLRPGAEAFVSYQPDPQNPDSLGSFQVGSLLQDRHGQLWIGTRTAGLERMEQSGAFARFIHYRHRADDAASLSHDEVWGLAEDKLGQLWVATYGGGVNVLDPQTGAFRHYRHRADDPASLPTDLVTAVFADRDGQMWIGTDGAGLLRYDPATDRFVALAAHAGGHAVVRAVYQDFQGKLWIGTYLGGVSQLKPAHPEFAYFLHDDADPNSLSDGSVASFAEDRDGQIWVGTEGGWLNRFDRKTQSFTRYRFPGPDGAIAAVLSLLCDRQGRIWVGSYRGGLASFDARTGAFVVYRHDPANPRTLANDEVWAMAEEADGTLWLATNAGLDHFDPARGEAIDHLQTPTAGGLSFSGIRALQLDRGGNLWIGSFGGLSMRPRHGGPFVHYQNQRGDPHSLSNDSVVALRLDAQDRLWVGTLGGGINLLDTAAGTFKTYQDFPSNVVNSIQEDATGRLWLSTNHGLSRFSPATGAVESYDLTNGLQSLQFHLGAGFRTRDGRLLFGSVDGFYDLDPAAVKPSSFVPAVVLTALHIFNVPATLPDALPTLEEVTLRPADKMVSVEFAALDFSFPRRNQYAYQLAGLSERWIQLGDKRELTFTNLEPSTYTLRIKASNSDGVWHDRSVTVLRLKVLPPLWGTWWFRSGALALAALGLVTLHRVRVRRLTLKLMERRRTETALRASEERFSRAFHVSPVPMCIVRLNDGIFVDHNDSFLELVGYSHAELIGRSPFELQLLTASDRERAAHAHAQPGGIREMDFQVRTKSGAVRTVLASVAITELGAQPCVLAVATDITERKRAEQALRDSEDRYRRFFDEDLAGTFICSPDGRLLVCNPAFARMFGFGSVAEAMCSDLGVLYPEPATAENLFQRLRTEHKLQDLEQEMRRRDGKPLYVVANVIGTFDDRNELVEVKGYAIDTTERKKLEAQLLQSQKMEAVGQLAGGVAHDFNNLLTGIIGYTDLLLMGNNLDEETSSTLQEIRGAGRRAAALTRQLLAFSRRQLLQPRVIDLNALVTEMEKMLRRLIGEDIDLRIALAPDLGRIKADRSQIEQVILNLAVNARDAMPRGGRLVLETADVVLDAGYVAEHVGVAPGSYVRLTVTDTGCGMEPEVQAKIFEPFFTTKGVGKGTGLGLSTVYGIVKQSNGHIALYSERDAGSVFKIYLPRFDAPTPADEPAAGAGNLPEGNEIILLVEDNEVVRKATAHILRRKGYQVLEAADAAAALDIFEQARPPVQLLFTDVIMPGLNGRELAEQLTARAPALRVLFMSGYTDDAISRHGGLDADFVFLEKPFAPDTLIAKVHEALRQRTAAK